MKAQSLRKLVPGTVLLLMVFSLALPAAAQAQDIFVDTGQAFGYSVDRTVLADLDGDGDLDIVTGNTYVGSAWYRNNGQGVFSSGGSVGPGDNGSKFVDVADFNGDGIPDIVVGGYTGVWFRLNSGGGNLGPLIRLADSSRQMGVCAGDMDGDGDIDIVVAGGGQAIYRNDGLASFTAIPQDLLGLGAEGAIALGDVDGDSDLDVVVANVILLNDGLGNLTDSGQRLPVLWFAWGHCFGDVDGDGDLDLAVADSGDSSKLFLNNGDGTFIDSQQLFPNAYRPVFADIDLDGDLDMAMQNRSTTYIYLNTGVGEFEFVQAVPAGSTYSASFGDLNGDLYPDLVQARVQWSGRIFRNQIPLFNKPPVLGVNNLLVTVAEGQMAYNYGVISDPNGDSITLDASLGIVTDNKDGTWLWSLAAQDGPTESNPAITISADDGKGGTAEASFALVVDNMPPAVGSISAPTDPVQGNTTINTSANFTDPGVRDTHTAVWDWNDGTTSSGTINETNGSGSVSGSHSYVTPGVYMVKLTVTDKDGEPGSAEFRYVVVYDPEGGFVTGGGWIDSPAGAYVPDQALTGRASFGFVSKYQKGATSPTGNTEFQFKSANLNFHSESYEWLVIAGAKAKYKGTGTINGQGEYRFMLSAIDGQMSDGEGVDKFRIRIWDKVSGDLVYDNQMGAEDDADPTTVIGGGSIVIHKD
jgi:hypothetical protein